VTLGGTVSGTLFSGRHTNAPNDGTTFDIAVSGMTGFGTVTSSIPCQCCKRPGRQSEYRHARTDTFQVRQDRVIVMAGFGCLPGLYSIGRNR